jgi:hypothetical protein
MIDYDTPAEDAGNYISKGASLLIILQEWIEASGATDQEAVELLSWSAGVLAKDTGIPLDVLTAAIRSKRPLFAAILLKAGELSREMGCGDPDCPDCGGGGVSDSGDDDEQPPKPPKENWKK